MSDLTDKARALREEAQRLLTEAGRLEQEQKALDRPEGTADLMMDHLFCPGCGMMRLHDIIVQKASDLTICRSCGTRERVTPFQIEAVEWKDGLGKAPLHLGMFALALKKIRRIAKVSP